MSHQGVNQHEGRAEYLQVGTPTIRATSHKSGAIRKIVKPIDRYLYTLLELVEWTIMVLERGKEGGQPLPKITQQKKLIIKAPTYVN